MADEKLGIKEIKEALVGVNALAVLLAERMKDGVGIDDAMAVWAKLSSDEAFKAQMVAAYQGISLVPAELKDIDLAEGMELAVLQIQMMPALLAALKK
jgi:hypothetical protein